LSQEVKVPEIPTIRSDILWSEPTASWRVMKPVIDYGKCVKCWLCVQYCPEGVISKSGEGPVIDYRFCKGCGVCANECPRGAIRMVREV